MSSRLPLEFYAGLRIADIPGPWRYKGYTHSHAFPDAEGSISVFWGSNFIPVFPIILMEFLDVPLPTDSYTE